MKTFARVPVIPGPVLEILIAEELPPFHEDVAATFHEAPDGTTEGMVFDGQSFNPAPPIVLTVMQQIDALETSITPRMIQEAIAGDTTVNKKTGMTSVQFIGHVRDQIAVLRTQLSAS